MVLSHERKVLSRSSFLTQVSRLDDYDDIEFEVNTFDTNLEGPNSLDVGLGLDISMTSQAWTAVRCFGLH